MSIVKPEGEMHFRAALKTPTIILTERHLLISPFLFSSFFLLFFSNYFSRICRHVDWKFISMVNRFSQNSYDYFHQNLRLLIQSSILFVFLFSNFTFSSFFFKLKEIYINIYIYHIRLIVEYISSFKKKISSLFGNYFTIHIKIFFNDQLLKNIYVFFFRYIL